MTNYTHPIYVSTLKMLIVRIHFILQWLKSSASIEWTYTVTSSFVYITETLRLILCSLTMVEADIFEIMSVKNADMIWHLLPQVFLFLPLFSFYSPIFKDLPINDVYCFSTLLERSSLLSTILQYLNMTCPVLPDPSSSPSRWTSFMDNL